MVIRPPHLGGELVINLTQDGPGARPGSASDAARPRRRGDRIIDAAEGCPTAAIFPARCISRTVFILAERERPGAGFDPRSAPGRPRRAARRLMACWRSVREPRRSGTRAPGRSGVITQDELRYGPSNARPKMWRVDARARRVVLGFSICFHNTGTPKVRYCDCDCDECENQKSSMAYSPLLRREARHSGEQRATAPAWRTVGFYHRNTVSQRAGT